MSILKFESNEKGLMKFITFPLIYVTEEELGERVKGISNFHVFAVEVAEQLDDVLRPAPV